VLNIAFSGPPAHLVSSDDEYRLLRQNVFEQYSGNMVIPVEAPIVPTARVRVQLGNGEPLLCPTHSFTNMCWHVSQGRRQRQISAGQRLKCLPIEPPNFRLLQLVRRQLSPRVCPISYAEPQAAELPTLLMTHPRPNIHAKMV